MTLEQIQKHPLYKFLTAKERDFLLAYSKTLDFVEATKRSYSLNHSWGLDSVIGKLRNKSILMQLVGMIDGAFEPTYENIGRQAMIIAATTHDKKAATSALNLAKQIADTPSQEKPRGAYRRDLSVLKRR